MRTCGTAYRLRKAAVFGMGYSVLVVTIALYTGTRAYSEPLTLEQAVARMRTDHESIKAAEEEVRQRDSEREAARGLRYPKAEVEIRRYVLDDPIKVGVDPIPAELEVQSDNFWKGEIEVTLPLYTGGRIRAANEAARARQDEAGALLRTTEHGLLTELAERYFGLLLAGRAREVQTLKVRVMEKQLARAQRLMDEGIIARIEFLNAEVAVSNARLELSDAEGTEAIARDALSNTVVSDVPVEPGSPLFLVRDIESSSEFQESVNADHPVLQTLEAKQHQAGQGVRAEKGDLQPTFYAFGMKELIPDDLTMLDPEWAVGLGMHYTLFDGFKSKHEVEAARAVEQRVAHLKKKYERDLKTLVLKRHEEMTTALEQYDSFGKTVELTRENLRVRTRAFEEGQATSIEVIDATLGHARALLGRFKAAYDFDISLFRLLEASGRSDLWHDYVQRGEPILEAALEMDPDGPVDIRPDVGLEFPKEAILP